jgi:predicted transposase YbfD/YdcC
VVLFGKNGLHWVLDVTFREDDSRVRDRTPRISIRARRKQAAWNDEYMLALLAG